MKVKAVAVYLGSREGHDPFYAEKVRELGAWLARKDLLLLYGGSSIGLMGMLAQSALDAGGEVVGVEPRFFIDAVPQLEGLRELIPTETMAERMTKLIELSDACIAFPGGIGTLEEISEVMSLINLGMDDRPCIFYNLNGFYDPLRAQLVAMADAGFVPPETLLQISFCETLEEIEERLA